MPAPPASPVVSRSMNSRPIAARRAREQIERRPRAGRRRQAVGDGHVAVAMAGRIPPLDDDVAMARRFVPRAAQDFGGIVRGPIVGGSKDPRPRHHRPGLKTGRTSIVQAPSANPRLCHDVAEAVLERGHQNGGGSASDCAGGGSSTASGHRPASSVGLGARGRRRPAATGAPADRGCAAPRAWRADRCCPPGRRTSGSRARTRSRQSRSRVRRSRSACIANSGWLKPMPPG